MLHLNKIQLYHLYQSLLSGDSTYNLLCDTILLTQSSLCQDLSCSLHCVTIRLAVFIVSRFFQQSSLCCDLSCGLHCVRFVLRCLLCHDSSCGLQCVTIVQKSSLCHEVSYGLNFASSSHTLLYVFYYMWQMKLTRNQ